METTTDARTIERVIEIDASPETVWQFLVDPGKATRWMGLSAVLDPRPGGLYRVEVVPGAVASGQFVELDPPRRLVQTWGWEGGPGKDVAPGSTRIEIELTPNGHGTTLRFRHTGLPGHESAAQHADGWNHYLERLAVVAGGGDPGRDPWASPR